MFSIMIYLHKIIPVLLLPLGLTIILILAGLIFRRRYFCFAGIIVLWVASTPVIADLAMRTAEGGQIRQPVATLSNADAIVVLSGGRTLAPGNPPVSEWNDSDRFFAGIELYKAGKAPLLIFTGGWAPWQPQARPEGEIMIPYAESMGVPRNRILTTGKVLNTAEEADAVADLLFKKTDTHVKSRILLVTSAFHMRRAKLLFERAGFQIVPFPVDFQVSTEAKLTPLAFIPSVDGLGMTETSMRELYGIFFYRMRFLWSKPS